MNAKIVRVEDFKNERSYKRFFNTAFPCCNLTRRFDISKLIKNKKHHKLNAMICFCMQNAGQKNEFCHYDFKDEKNLLYFENVCTNIVMYGKDDHLYYVSTPYSSSYTDYEKNYIRNYNIAYEECRNIEIPDQALVSSSAIINTPILSFQSSYSDDFKRPFLVWGKYERKCFKYYLNITFRFHHSIFVGRDIGDFFNELQKEFNSFKTK